ncbi:MAG: DinB family protein [Microlunatus sp.]|nr:DinB family protein [Microlunatus sp.]
MTTNSTTLSAEQIAALKYPPPAGTDVEILLGSLERMRRTFSWKASGVPDEQSRTVTVGTSTLTLSGLMKHLTYCEYQCFMGRFLYVQPPGPPDSAAHEDWYFTPSADETPEVLLAGWQLATQKSREIVAEALAGESGLDTMGKLIWPDGRSQTLRAIITDLIEEYGRHTGHADLIRESIDGVVGEDPPD